MLVEKPKLVQHAVGHDRTFEQLKLKQAILAGASELLTVGDVAKMKSRDELVAELAELVGSPGRALAGCLASPQ